MNDELENLIMQAYREKEDGLLGLGTNYSAINALISKLSDPDPKVRNLVGVVLGDLNIGKTLRALASPASALEDAVPVRDPRETHACISHMQLRDVSSGSAALSKDDMKHLEAGCSYCEELLGIFSERVGRLRESIDGQRVTVSEASTVEVSGQRFRGLRRIADHLIHLDLLVLGRGRPIIAAGAMRKLAFGLTILGLLVVGLVVGNMLVMRGPSIRDLPTDTSELLAMAGRSVSVFNSFSGGRGGSNSDLKLSPDSETVTSIRPLLRWQPLAGTIRISEVVLTKDGKLVARLAFPTVNIWRVSSDLVTSSRYTWTVKYSEGRGNHELDAVFYVPSEAALEFAAGRKMRLTKLQQAALLVDLGQFPQAEGLLRSVSQEQTTSDVERTKIDELLERIAALRKGGK